jgi:hypothetical protein
MDKQEHKVTSKSKKSERIKDSEVVCQNLTNEEKFQCEGETASRQI